MAADEPKHPDWDHWAELPGLSSVLDPNDRAGGKNTIIDRIQWRALSKRIRPGSSVLDFGCGTGRFGLRIRAQRSAYIGVDQSYQMVRIARKNLQGSGVWLSQFDGERLPFPDGVFNTCICCGVFQYHSKTLTGEAMIREICRVLAPSGRILLIEQVSWSGQTSGSVSTTTTQEDLCAQLRQCFAVIRCKPLRSSHQTVFTRWLLRWRKVPSWSIAAAAWIEATAMQLMTQSAVRRLAYYDVLIEAAPITRPST